MKGKEEEINPLNHLQLKHQSSERYSYKVYSLLCPLCSIKMQDGREGEPDDKTIKIKEKEAKDLGERSDRNKYYKVSFARKLGQAGAAGLVGTMLTMLHTPKASRLNTSNIVRYLTSR